MTTTVVTITNRIPTEPYYRYPAWEHSLARFGVKPVVLGLDQPWHGLITKPRTLRKWLKDGKCDADCLVFTDSWDVLFLAHPDEIANEWANMGKPWLCGAERALFPPADESKWPQCASSFRFLNSGAIISTPKDMLDVLDAMNPDALPGDHVRADGSHHHANDQEILQALFLKQPIPMRLDTECRFIWNLCDVTEKDYDFIGDRLFNKETGTFPIIAHANGSAKEKEPFLTLLNKL